MHISAEAVGLVPALALGYALVARAEPPGPSSSRRCSCRTRSHLRAVCDRAAAARAAHVPLGAPPAERRARRVGACAARARDSACARPPRRAARPVPPGGRAAALDRDVRRLASALGYDYALAASALAAARRARDVPRRRHCTLVAGRARRAISAGAKAAYLFGAFVLASPIGLMLALVPRPFYSFYAHARAHVGAGTARRPADRRRDDGGRAGRRLLRGLRAVPVPLPAGGGA